MKVIFVQLILHIWGAYSLISLDALQHDFVVSHVPARW